MLAAHEAVGGRHWLLGTGSPGAAKLYQSLGFGHLAGGLDGGTKGWGQPCILGSVQCVCGPPIASACLKFR